MVEEIILFHFIFVPYRHPRVGGDPSEKNIARRWIPAYAGMTKVMDCYLDGPSPSGDDEVNGLYLDGPPYAGMMKWCMKPRKKL